MRSVIMLTVVFICVHARFYYSECNYADYAKWHSDECHYANVITRVPL
jgi:hypothetical protein